MVQSKLFRQLENIDNEELYEIISFIEIPTFAISPKSTMLLKIIAKERRSFKENKITKETFFKRLYPGKAFTDILIRKIMSQASAGIEQFFASKKLLEDKFLSAEYALNYARENKNEQVTSSKLYRLSKLLKHKEGQDYFLKKFRLTQLKWTHIMTTDVDHKTHKSINLLKDMLSLLDEFQCWESSKVVLNLSSLLSIYSQGSSSEIDSRINQIIESDTSSTISGAGKLIVELIRDKENEDNYVLLKDAVFTNESILDQESLYFIIKYLLNFCVVQINKGNSKYLEEFIEICQFGFQTDALKINGYFAPADFKNTVTIALRLKKLDWVKRFISSYVKQLPQEEIENAYTYNQARYHFANGEYGKSMRLLLQVEYKDIFYLLDSKSLLLKTFYELKEWDSLFSLMHSFKGLLRRKNLLSTARRKSFSNLIRFTGRLSKIVNKDIKVIERLERDIGKAERIADKTWLLDKIEELKS